MIFKIRHKLLISLFFISLLSACGNEYHPETIDISQLLQEAEREAKIENAVFKDNRIKIYYTNLHDVFTSFEEIKAFRKKMKNYVPEYPRSLAGIGTTIALEHHENNEQTHVNVDIAQVFDESSYFSQLRQTEVGEHIAELLIKAAELEVFVAEKRGGDFVSFNVDFKGQKSAVKMFSDQLDELGIAFKNQYADKFMNEYVLGVQEVDLNQLNTFEADFDSGLWLVEMHLSGKTRRGKQKSLTVGAIVNTAYLSENARAALMNSEVFEPSLDDKTIEAINGFIANKGEHFLTRSYF